MILRCRWLQKGPRYTNSSTAKKVSSTLNPRSLSRWSFGRITRRNGQRVQHGGQINRGHSSILLGHLFALPLHFDDKSLPLRPRIAPQRVVHDSALDDWLWKRDVCLQRWRRKFQTMWRCSPSWNRNRPQLNSTQWVSFLTNQGQSQIWSTK